MASFEKYTNAAIENLLRHNDRLIRTSSNKDIDPDRKDKNYSFPLNHKESDYLYYKMLRDNCYLYGRGSEREKQAVTGCGWVVTLPRELYGNLEKENKFFQGTFNFIADRYGEDNIINNAVHRDEAGLPHLHVLFCPVTTLDHDVIQYKTIRTTNAARLASGRYEYTYRFKLDEHGERIKLKNYAKKSDFYDKKIDANSVMNKVELQHFHMDLQKYLTDHGIEGSVLTGGTGVNLTVKELKEFTTSTGMKLNEVKEMLGNQSLLEHVVTQSNTLQQLTELNHKKDCLISTLQERLCQAEKELLQTKEKLQTVASEKKLESLQEHTTWGEQSGWGDTTHSGWGTCTANMEEEKPW